MEKKRKIFSVSKIKTVFKANEKLLLQVHPQNKSTEKKISQFPSLKSSAAFISFLGLL